MEDTKAKADIASVYNANVDHFPAVTPPMLYTRTKEPRNAFAKFDKANSGTLPLEEMRSAFSALGIKLSLQEAKAMMIRQRGGDRGAAMKDMKFAYDDFLSQMGIDKTREAARSERLAKEEDHAATDINNPVPTESAAAAIIERLRRERGTAGEGYLVSLTTETPRMKPTEDLTLAKSELDKIGGLTKYLSEDHVETAPAGYLPRMPGEPYARKAVDDRLFTKGEFTSTGLGQWIKEGEVVPEGYQALPGQQPHRKPQDGSLFTGQLDKAGGISAYIADVATERKVPDGYAYVFPGDAAPRRVGAHPSQDSGEIADRGGLVAYLADSTTDSKAMEGYLPRAPGQQYAHKEADTLHQNGEFTSKGIGRFILEDPTVVDGYVASVTSMSPRKVTRDAREAFLQHGGFVTSARERSTDEAGNVKTAAHVRSGFHAAVDDDDVPVLPEDLKIEGTVNGVQKEGVHTRAMTDGRTGAIDEAGTIYRYVTKMPKDAPTPAKPTDFPERKVGTISKAGGLGSYVASSGSTEDGYLAPLPGQAFAKNAADASVAMGSKGAVETAGTVYAFMTDYVTAEVPEGYLPPLHPGDSPRKKADIDKAFLGTLDKFGGIGGFFNKERGAGEVLPGEEYLRQVNLEAERAANAGRVEGAGGIGKFMMSSNKPPEGYVTDISGENIRLAPNNVAHQGTLEKFGGLSGWASSKEQLEDGYRAMPGQDKRKAIVDPLHHYGTIAAEGTAFALEGKTGEKEADVSEHKRLVRLNSGRIAGKEQELALDDHVRLERHLSSGRVVELNKEAEISPYAREGRIVGGRFADSRPKDIVLGSDGRATSLIELERDTPRALTRDVQGTTTDARATSLVQVKKEQQEQKAAQQGGSSSAHHGGAAAQLPKPVQSAFDRADADSLPGHSQDNAVSEYRVSSPTTGAGYASRHAKQATTSPRTAGSSQGGQSVDVRRLARVRKAIRDMLPKKSQAAQTLLRQKLHKEDGDQDGVISDIELLRGLCGITPGLAASDVGFLIRYFKDKFRAHADKLTPEGLREADTTGGLSAGLAVAAVAEWVTKQPGGHESRYNKDGDGDGEAEPQAGALTTAGDRLTWTSRAQKFNQFRAQWEQKHGQAAMKELTHDLAQPVDGPTWARANPEPFKVLRLAAGAPSPKA